MTSDMLITQSGLYKKCRSDVTVRALVVDDCPDHRMLMGHFLAALGVEVDFAVDGAEALARYAYGLGQYAMVVMDCQMPVLDGVTAAEKMRMVEAELDAEHVPILLISTDHEIGESAEFNRSGATAFLAKPFYLNDLYQVLIRCVPDAFFSHVERSGRASSASGRWQR